jgi:pyrroloquinoline quinone biosynthesis protein D
MTLVSQGSVPKLRRGIIRKFDAARGQNVLLGPEKVILLDDIGHAILECCDGQASISQISCTLAERYETQAVQIEPDIVEFVQELLDKGLVTA